MKFDARKDSSGNVVGAGTFQTDTPNAPNWFTTLVLTAGSNVKLVSTFLKPDNTQVVADWTNSDTTTTLKAVSRNKKWALAYPGNAGTNIKVISFDLGASGTVPGGNVRTLDITGITVDANTKFDISVDGNGVRVATKVWHWDGSSYVLDTYPTGMTAFTNPTFSEDWTTAVDDDKIYNFTAKGVNGAATGSYAVDRVEAYDPLRTVYKFAADRYLIFTYKQVASTTNYTFKIQANRIISSTSTKIYEATGTVDSVPTLYVSPKGQTVLLVGKLSTDNTKPAYFLKTIDWMGKAGKDVTIDATLAGLFNDVAVSDQFVYFRNKAGAAGAPAILKHYGYVVSGSTLT